MIEKIAVFDLDHTLIKGDSSALWAEYLHELGWITSPDFKRQHQQMMETYAKGNLDMNAYLALNLSPLMGREYERVYAEAERFVSERVLPLIYPDAVHLIHQLRQQGEHLLMISASEVFLVEPVANALGFDGVIGIDVEHHDGKITGNPLLPLSYQEGKIHHYHAYLERFNTSESQVISRFYSDSHNDIPLLEKVQFPVAVNPNDALLQVAQEQQWPILNWS